MMTRMGWGIPTSQGRIYTPTTDRPERPLPIQQAACALLVQRNIIDPCRIKDRLPVLGLQWESLSWIVSRFNPVNHGCFLVAQAEADK